jgi:hypothetical protein
MRRTENRVLMGRIKGPNIEEAKKKISDIRLLSEGEKIKN